jgi:hypothetical protein
VAIAPVSRCIRPEQIPIALPKYLFSLCQAHLAILLVANLVFERVPANLDGFRKDTQNVFVKIHRFNEQHDNEIVHHQSRIEIRSVIHYGSAAGGRRA